MHLGRDWEVPSSISNSFKTHASGGIHGISDRPSPCFFGGFRMPARWYVRIPEMRTYLGLRPCTLARNHLTSDQLCRCLRSGCRRRNRNDLPDFPLRAECVKSPCDGRLAAQESRSTNQVTTCFPDRISTCPSFICSLFGLLSTCRGLIPPLGLQVHSGSGFAIYLSLSFCGDGYRFPRFSRTPSPIWTCRGRDCCRLLVQPTTHTP
ncbi:hypothetical protein QBC33DRAFT_145574 [Phialemonium atrogriseum]|uniref:Uncharacterized protein n=1 Tax=Phialemonium atrogriseum TaxID=1093897 RepID=A0AAJ0BY53_9PEZI|nr:uncharacterized protein QBC33DRAFT_145574 [Phialemonium atrogriseum]KAK1765558.1 hypothetical protein QBC33DRAFT_145574 [Phialemonium atrogriseum]